MEDNARKLIEARRVISQLLRTCRQARTYLDGVSAMDEKRLRRTIQESVQAADKFLQS